MKKLVLLSILAAALSPAFSNFNNTKKESKDLTVSLIHMNDHHSHLEADSTITVTLGGASTKVKLGGMAEVANQIKEFRKTSKNPIVLHAGDAITGTLYFTLFAGSADAEIMNAIGFDVFTLGNHEFDAKNEGLKKFLDVLKVPTISYNTVADKGSILEGYWKPYMIKEVEGQKIGIVGIDVVKKTKESSSPGEDIKFYDEIESVRRAVKELESMGINKIVVLSHAGSEINQEIARKVSGVDVILSGDTHYLYANQDLKDRGFPVIYEYPTKIITPDGTPCYVGEAWEYGKMVGNLEVTFDSNGVVKFVKANPKIIVNKDFFERRKTENGKTIKYQATGEEKEAIIKDINENPWLTFGEPDAEVLKLVNKFKKEKDVLADQKIGSITGDVMPGGSDNRIPGKPGADPRGSVATRFVAETMLSEMRNMGTGAIDFVIQNSGGVRANVEPGVVTYNDAYTFLPFGNTLYTINIKGNEVKLMLEQALDYALVNGSTGAFPYGAAIRYEAVEDAPFGSRVKKVEIENRKTGKYELLDLNKMYTMGTNIYLSTGKDGYYIIGEISKDPSRNGTDTGLPDAESFIKFMKRNPGFKAYTESNVKFTPKK